MTDRAVASDSTIIVGAILINAKRTVIPPMSIAYTDIVAIKKKKTNVLATVAVCGSIVAACWGIVSALGNFGPIGQ